MPGFAELKIPNTFYRVSVKAAIWREHKLLLVREHGASWVLPGGGLDHGESLADGLRRELAEELDINGPITIAPEPTHVNLGISPRRSDMPYRDIPQCFVCYNVSVAGEIKPGPHTREMRFWSPAEIDEAPMNDESSAIKTIITNEH